MNRFTSAGLAVLCACAAPLASSAQPAGQTPDPNRTNRSQCFFVTQFQQWKDKDDKTFYIRVNLHDYYRIDVANSCPELTFPEARLVTVTRGPDTICGPLDWDLRVTDEPTPSGGIGRGLLGGGSAVGCIVTGMTKLTPEEAAAIPKKYKPD